MVSRQIEQGRQGTSFRDWPWWRKIVTVILAAVVVALGYLLFQKFLRVAATILLLAVLFTYLLQPVVEWLVRVSKLKQQHAARIGATLFAYCVLAVMLYFVGAAAMHALVSNVHDLQQTWNSASQHVPRQVTRLQQWYLSYVPHTLQDQIRVSVQREVGHISDKYIPAIANSLVGLAKWAGQWAALLIELIFVPLIAFYFLTDAAKLREQTLFFVPKPHRSSVVRYAAEMDRILRRYVQSQVILCLIAWIAVTIGLLLMGIPGALLLGVIAGVSRAIPVVGPVVGGVPVLAAVLLEWPGAFWWVLIGFTALHFAESKFLMPRILGDRLGVHPVIVILSLLIGYEMLGLLGMFLAPPAIAMARFVLAMRRGEDAEEQPELPGMETLLSDTADKNC